MSAVGTQISNLPVRLSTLQSGISPTSVFILFFNKLTNVHGSHGCETYDPLKKNQASAGLGIIGS